MAAQSKQVMLVVGEASGDIHGAHLVRALSGMNQTLRFFGVGGEQLNQTKFEVLFDVSQLAGMGFVELAGSVRNIKKYLKLSLIQLLAPNAKKSQRLVHTAESPYQMSSMDISGGFSHDQHHLF